MKPLYSGRQDTTQQRCELLSAGDRRVNKLPPRPAIASLYKVDARMKLGCRIVFEAVEGTQEGQTAVAT